MNTRTNRPSRNRRRSFSSNGSRGIASRNRRRGGFNRGGRGSGRGQGRKRAQPTFNPAQFINKNPVDYTPEVYEPTNTFRTFGLRGNLIKAIDDLGITTPSPIQDQIIPEILAGNDVVGLAETGTGKTAAFLVPLINQTIADNTRQTLILAPTRELAIQIQDELRKLTKHCKMYSTICVGGTNIRPQIQGLKRKNHFIIGTPGRIMDLMDRNQLRTDRVTTVVLDEADRMLDMGFINDMRKILSAVPEERETLFFSATMDKKTEALVHDFLKDPVTISVKKKAVTDSIEQDVVPFNSDNKLQTLLDTLDDSSFSRVIIFSGMKHQADKLARELSRNDIKAESIHGNKSHGQRQTALRKFKSGNARVLVATDVAARGIHVDNVTHVINYDLPQTFEDYVHRIGRTGRGEKRGQALTFIPTTTTSGSKR